MYAWGNFFLPDPVHMQVFAVVEDVSYEDLVLMTCEDKQVYAYEDECLHLVALSLKELLKEGLRWPAYEKYYEGDAFKHMTEEDWAKEMQSPLGKKLDEEHRKLVESFEPRIMEILRNTRSKQELTADSTDESSCMLSGAGLKEKKEEQLNYSHLEGQQLDLSKFPTRTERTVQHYLWKYGLTNKGQTITLKKPPGAKLRITDVDDTVYRRDDVYEWGNFCLRYPVHMQVFAVVEDVSWQDLVLMTCEDKQVYAYEDECLHLVAFSLEELLEEGLRWPAYEEYEVDAFRRRTKQDWAKEMQSPLEKKLDEEHRELMESFEPRIVGMLRNTRSKQDLTSDSTDERSCMLSGAGSYM
ncbi:uncharacterized protein LOC114865588 [Betta splendens]|uniref:Uncharacterized protein LOC114865588 n=1 Tax=Betta splendens TaxID=158456 RepID=A0A6P7NXH0_BETSP|nr:uncharacterized protein LOC114865588 [Betta splendens]